MQRPKSTPTHPCKPEPTRPCRMYTLARLPRTISNFPDEARYKKSEGSWKLTIYCHRYYCRHHLHLHLPLHHHHPSSCYCYSYCDCYQYCYLDTITMPSYQSRSAPGRQHSHAGAPHGCPDRQPSWMKHTREHITVYYIVIYYGVYYHKINNKYK